MLSVSRVPHYEMNVREGRSINLRPGEARRRFRGYASALKRVPALVALLILAALLAIAFTAPFVAPYDPLRTRVGDPLRGPSNQHLMGTDHLGRDVFSGFAYGARVSAVVGFVSASLSTIIGILVGLPAGYRGGLIDDVLMRVVEFFQIMPLFVVALLATTLVGGSVFNVTVIIGLLSWAPIARTVRVQTLSLSAREFVMAARALGASEVRILVRHILPNSAGPVIVISTLQVGSAILAEAGLSFMGVGDPNLISWGQQLQDAQRYLRTAWWMAVFPGAAIFFVVLSCNLLGDFLHEIANPFLRR